VLYGSKDIIENNSGDDINAEYSYQDVTMIYNDNLELVSSLEGEVKTVNMETFDMEENVMESEIDSQGRKISLCNTFKADNDEYIVKVNDKDGNEITKIKLENMGMSLVQLSDGTVSCLVYGNKGLELYAIDIEGEKLGKKIADFGNSFSDRVYAGLDNSILYNLDGFLCRYDIEKGKSQKITKFLDSNINQDDISLIFERNDGTLGIVLRNYENEKTEIDFLVKQEGDKNVKKEEIHLGTLYLDSLLQQKVLEFNKTNEKYRIVVDEYANTSDGNELDDYRECIKRFNAAITSGNCPDIIDLSAMSFQGYAQKGILEDLIPYFEKDDEIKEEQFVDSVLNTYKMNGKLYTLPANFSINVLAGATSSVGNEMTWNMQEFIAYAQSLPEGMEILDGLTSDGFLMNVLLYNMNEYVNLNTGECNFNSEEFIKLLEYCSKYESSEKYYENYDEENETSEVSKIRNKQVAMQSLYLNGIEDYMASKTIFGEPITIKGYPSKDGNGIAIDTNSFLLGISSKSKYKDVAWEFMRNFYTKESQETEDGMSFGFPVRKDALDEMFQKAKDVETLTAPDGTKYTVQWGFDDITLYVPAPTDEDINTVKDIISKADTFINLNEEIYSMVQEEAEAYFKGQKTAKEVADVIQSRVSIYIKESR
nr:extracellular solute-binding protein [Lachnospiraceae bacterium]